MGRHKSQKVYEKDVIMKTGGRVEAINKVHDLMGTEDYDKFVRSLGKLADDPKVMTVLSSGLFDGKRKDEAFATKVKTIPVKDLVPTQNEIDVDKSLSLSLSAKFPETLQSMLKGKDVQIVAPIVVLNEKFILDGHHRWSQIYALNKDAKAKVLSFYGDIDPVEMLKVLQIAIATELGEVPTAVVKGKNLLKVNDRETKKAILDNLSDKAIQMMVDEGKIDAFDKNQAVDYVMDNIKSMRKTSQPIEGAPSRAVMPQTTEADYTIPNTKKGVINYMKPFKSGGEVESFIDYWESQPDDEIVVLLYESHVPALHSVIRTDKSIIENDDNTFEVADVVYKPGKTREDLLDIVRIWDTEFRSGGEVNGNFSKVDYGYIHNPTAIELIKEYSAGEELDGETLKEDMYTVISPSGFDLSGSYETLKVAKQTAEDHYKDIEKDIESDFKDYLESDNVIKKDDGKYYNQESLYKIPYTLPQLRQAWNEAYTHHYYKAGGKVNEIIESMKTTNVTEYTPSEYEAIASWRDDIPNYWYFIQPGDLLSVVNNHGGEVFALNLDDGGEFEIAGSYSDEEIKNLLGGGNMAFFTETKPDVESFTIDSIYKKMKKGGSTYSNGGEIKARDLIRVGDRLGRVVSAKTIGRSKKVFETEFTNPYGIQEITMESNPKKIGTPRFMKVSDADLGRQLLVFDTTDFPLREDINVYYARKGDSSVFWLMKREDAIELESKGYKVIPVSVPKGMTPRALTTGEINVSTYSEGGEIENYLKERYANSSEEQLEMSYEDYDELVDRIRREYKVASDEAHNIADELLDGYGVQIFAKGGSTYSASSRKNDYRHMSDEKHEIQYAISKGLKSRPGYKGKNKRIENYLLRGGDVGMAMTVKEQRDMAVRRLIAMQMMLFELQEGAIDPDKAIPTLIKL